MVSYRVAQLCKDGVRRKTIWYRRRPTGVGSASVAAGTGRQRAERLAWEHIEAVLRRPLEALEIEQSVGLGPLSGTGYFRRHGDPLESYTFHVHPRRPDFLARMIWRPLRDTLEAPHRFCHSADFVRRLPDGTEVYRCRGHEVLGSGGGRALPEALRGRPLEGKKPVEVFSGVESEREAGAMLSRVWEEAGGSAERFDNRIDERIDFLSDTSAAWREQQLEEYQQLLESGGVVPSSMAAGGRMPVRTEHTGISEHPSTRVHAAPGGNSSLNIFAGSAPAAPACHTPRGASALPCALAAPTCVGRFLSRLLGYAALRALAAMSVACSEAASSWRVAAAATVASYKGTEVPHPWQ